MKRITEMNRGFQYIETKIKEKEKRMITLSGIKITRRELIYLVIVHDHEGDTLTEILGSSGVTKATLSNQVKVLVKKGFIKSTTDIKDSRKKRLSLSPKGEEAYQLHVKIRKDILDEYDDILTSKEVEQIITIGRKIIEKLKKVD